MRTAFAIALLLATISRAADSEYKAGVATVVITPKEYIWMAGYGARNKPAGGKQHELYAKAVALEDAAGAKLVIVGTDLVGLPRAVTAPVAEAVTKKTSLPRERLMFTSSHTHCGPVVRDNLMDMYDMTPAMRQKVAAYGEELKRNLTQVILDALADLKPAQLRYAQGTAKFAVNRREVTATGIINGKNPAGPVDHDVPVLEVATPEGKLRAVLFGYACHNTTLSFYEWCGDYAGFAQFEIQANHPGAVALFWMGCGADANPLPRGTVALCKQYGRELASTVEDVLISNKRTPVKGSFTARYAETALPFDAIPPKTSWETDRESKTFAVRTRAARMLETIATVGKIDDHYRYYPVQVWKLGDLLWISLGGEVVVDYSRRLKRTLGKDRPLWVTAYANDVMAYIPSLRVLREGGYEADSSMIYYGMPTKWGTGIEELIIDKVKELAK
jgi:Neutral/alkaline non-lysosomal ceramidase, N-terminal